MLSEEQIEDDITKEKIDNIINRLMPYQKYIMIYGMIILILLVVFLGFAYGMAKMCNEFGGIVDGALQCHQMNYSSTTQAYGGDIFPLNLNAT